MRRPYLLFYALIFLDEVALLALVPLLPSYTRAYHLSSVQAGALLAAASLAIVVASVPAGRLSDRFGARRVTLAALTRRSALTHHGTSRFGPRAWPGFSERSRNPGSSSPSYSRDHRISRLPQQPHQCLGQAGRIYRKDTAQPLDQSPDLGAVQHQ